MLAMASVIGRDSDVNLLAESTGEDEDTLLDLLEEAQRAALVSELYGGDGPLQLHPCPGAAHALRGSRPFGGCTWAHRPGG